MMKDNMILNNQVHIFNGEITHDPGKANNHLIILIKDEYVKSKSYQNMMRENRQFSVGGNILYLLLTELFDYITRLFERIRLEDLNLNEGNKTLLFLKKFSNSSSVIEEKLKRLNSLAPSVREELFILHIAGMENKIDFSRNREGNSRLRVQVPLSYVYNRLMSFVDQMEFTDLNKIDSETRVLFLKQFGDLNQRIMDQKKQIEMKYALELAQERARDLEEQNAKLMNKINFFKYQNELYKRSYFSLKNRYKSGSADGNEIEGDENLEEL